MDELTSGLQKQDLVILAARPGVGKTAMALNIAAHAALRSDLKVAVFSLEMSGHALVRRLQPDILSNHRPASGLADGRAACF